MYIYWCIQGSYMDINTPVFLAMMKVMTDEELIELAKEVIEVLRVRGISHRRVI